MRIGIIGFGARAALWRHAHRPGRGAEVVAVCDVSERGRADARAQLGPDVVLTDDLDQLLGLGLDAVLVTTPDHLHHGPTVAALEAGTAVFCEKPLGISIEECDDVLTTARRTGTRLYLGHNMRHMPVVTLMRDLVTAGRIGEVKAIWCRHFVGHGGDYYFKDWHADRSRSTSLLLQKGAHDLDVIHWLGGGYTARVQAMGDLAVYGAVTDRRDRSEERMADWFSLDNWPPASQRGLNPVVDVEDISMMTMRLDNGVLASYAQCHFTPDYWRNYTVIGTEGRIENLGDGPGARIAVWDRRHPSGLPEPDDVVTVPAAEGGHGGADPELVEEFLRFVASGGPTRTSPVAARMAVAAGVLATRSLRGDGRTLDVPPLPQDLVDYFERGQVEL
nr:Gfo/Idh/MocA family oxidoreductase [Auraticoccus cholistanensis]